LRLVEIAIICRCLGRACFGPESEEQREGVLDGDLRVGQDAAAALRGFPD
jgi:hypothetical protein